MDYRKAGREARKALSTDVHHVYSDAICESIKNMLLGKKVIMLYVPFDGEVDVTPLKEFFWQTETSVLLPKIQEDILLPFHVFPHTVMEPGKYGIMEPRRLEFLGVIDAIVVPMCAFDENLNRAGFGKGYYDRFLKKQESMQGRPLLKIGAVFSCQRADKLLEKPTDIKMDRIVTENEILGV